MKVAQVKGRRPCDDLNPCQWGGAPFVTATADTAVPSLRLTKGGNFRVRVHDPRALLKTVEAANASAVSVLVTEGSGRQRPLPVIYDDGHVRDYGDVLPIGQPMKVSVNSAKLKVSDSGGGNAQGVPFQVADPPAASTHGWNKFPRSNATVVHVNITGQH